MHTYTVKNAQYGKSLVIKFMITYDVTIMNVSELFRTKNIHLCVHH